MPFTRTYNLLFFPRGTWRNISAIGGNKIADYVCATKYRAGVMVVLLCVSGEADCRGVCILFPALSFAQDHTVSRVLHFSVLSIYRHNFDKVLWMEISCCCWVYEGRQLTDCYWDPLHECRYNRTGNYPLPKQPSVSLLKTWHDLFKILPNDKCLGWICSVAGCFRYKWIDLVIYGEIQANRTEKNLVLRYK